MDSRSVRVIDYFRRSLVSKMIYEETPESHQHKGVEK